MSGAVPPPTARPPERAARVPRPVCPGCGRCGRVDPAPAPQRAPLRAGVPRCGGGGRASPGGVPSTVVRGAWCQALSLPQPPVLWSGQPGLRDPCVPGAVDAGVWAQHRPHSLRPCGLALLAVGVAEGRPRGGVPSTVVRGAWCQALSLPRPPVLWSGLPGFRYPCVPVAVDAGVWTLHRPHSVRPCGMALLAVGVAEGRFRGGVPSTVVRGAWCQALSLPRPPVLWSGQPGFRCACVFVCVLCLAGSGGPASWARSGAPQLFHLAALSFCFAWPPPGWGCPPVSRCCCRSSLPGPLFFFFFFRLPLPCSPCARAWFVSPAWPLAARWWLLPRFLSLLLGARGCFFFPLVLVSPCAPVVSGLLWFPAPGALGLGACVVCFVGLPLLGSLCACPSFVLSAWLLAAPWWLLPPPPPPFVSRGFRRCRSVLCAVLCCASLGAALRRAAARCVARCCAVVCCVALVWCRCLLRRALWRCPSPWGPVLCGAVFCGVPPRCVLCAVCVLSWRGGACCCSPLCFVLCVSRGAVLCVPCALRFVRRCASLCWCARVVLFVWCVLLLAPGAVVRCCVLCCFLWCAVVRCWVCWPVGVCCWRVSVSVSLSGRVVCFPVVGVVCCGALLSCVLFCGAVPSRGAVLLCSAVVLRCCWGLLCPPVGCRAVLCCAVGWLCCFLPGGGVCVLWCSFPRAVRSLSSPLCALRCLVVLAAVPCFPVSCAVALCCRVVLCCRALLSFCGAVCVCFALLRPVVRRQCGLRCCWCLVLWRVPVRCGVSLGVLRCGGAALVCRGVLLCCALSCGVLRPVPCPAVPCCPAVLCWFVSCVGVVVPT